MTAQRFLLIIAVLLISSAGFALAQGQGKQPPAKQSAPSESTEAAGHDAQAGKPETGEKKKTDRAKKSTKADQETGRSTPPK